MAFDSDSLNRRTLGPAIASGAVGITLGIVAIIGVAMFSSGAALPEAEVVNVNQSVLGDPEYGSRK